MYLYVHVLPPYNVDLTLYKLAVILVVISNLVFCTFTSWVCQLPSDSKALYLFVHTQETLNGTPAYASDTIDSAH